MRINKTVWLLVLLQPVLLLADETLVQWGDYSISKEEYEEHLAEKFAPQEVPIFLDRQDRVGQSIEALMIKKIISEQGKAAGLDSDEEILRKLESIKEDMIINKWRKQYLEAHDNNNYDQLAYEHYLANKENYVSEESRDVRHILIGTDKLTEAEALAKITALREDLIKNPDKFEKYVTDYSDDPSKSKNKGLFENVGRGRMVPEFEEAMFSIEQVGDISEPVKTVYGYHIIQLLDLHPPKELEFEEVKPKIVKSIQSKYQQELWQAHIEASRPKVEPIYNNDAFKEIVEAANANLTK